MNLWDPQLPWMVELVDEGDLERWIDAAWGAYVECLQLRVVL